MPTNPGAVLEDVDPKGVCQVDVARPEPVAMESYFSFQPALQLLPEIRIDTSRLDGLLSGFQQRLQALETSFAMVAETAAETAHKAGVRVEHTINKPVHMLKIMTMETSCTHYGLGTSEI